MALNSLESGKISYRAKIEWFKERFAGISNQSTPIEESLEYAKKHDMFLNYTSPPDELISILDDLQKKAKNLEDRIDSVSKNLKIPIDTIRQPDISAAVLKFDFESKGEYLSYPLYKSLLEQRQLAVDNINIMEIVDSATGDISADSMFVKNKILEGMAKSSEVIKPEYAGDNSLERYTNRYINNIFTWDEHDQQTRQILNFADNYLQINPDPAYSPWKLRQTTSYRKVRSRNLSEFWTNFSDEYRNQKNELVGGLQGLSSLKPDPKIHDISKRYINYTNEILNGINSVFDMDYGSDLICCFVRWAGGLNIKTLKGLRALAQLLRNGLAIDYNSIVNSIIDIVNNILRGLIEDKLLGYLHQIIQRLLDPIKEWINDPDKRWELIFICTPIDDFIHKYLIYGIEWIENQLESLIHNFYKRIELDYLKDSAEITLISENKWLSNLINMLDMVISSLNRSAICGTRWSPTGEEVQKLMRDYHLGQYEPWEYPEEETPTIYNSFAKRISEEGKIIKMGTDVVDAGVGDYAEPKINECLRMLKPDEIIPIKQWMK